MTASVVRRVRRTVMVQERGRCPGDIGSTREGPDLDCGIAIGPAKIGRMSHALVVPAGETRPTVPRCAAYSTTSAR